LLFEIFNAIGPVQSIRVCRDISTRRSLGYAYVNFHSVADAEKAIDTMNNTEIMGKPCRIMWSQRDPSARKSGTGNVFVKNLDPSIGHKELFDYFSNFGPILSCKVALDDTGVSKGYGFVHFENEKAAQSAVDNANNKLLGSKEIVVGFFIPKKARVQNLDSSWTNVYVKDIDPTVTDEQFRKVFEAYGNVNSSLIKRDENSNSLFGFVNFENHEDAQSTVENLNGSLLGSKRIVCCRAQKKSDRETRLKQAWEQQKYHKYHGVNLYVKHIEDEIDEDALKREFSAFGEVKSCKIVIDEKTKISKGFGYVCFSTPEEAQCAILGLNSKILTGCKKPLFVALHESKESRKQKLAQIHNSAMTKNIRGFPPTQPIYYPNPTPFMFPQVPFPSLQNDPRRYSQQFQLPPNFGSSKIPTSAVKEPHGITNPAKPTRPIRPNNRKQSKTQQQMQQQQQQHHQQQQQHLPIPHELVNPALSDFNLANLSQFPHDQQKLLLGERLYPLIQVTHGTLAGKITGMFLDSGWPTEELLSLIYDDQKLQQKITSAMEVLHRAQVALQDDVVEQ